jgi:hypothetical protein
MIAGRGGKNKRLAKAQAIMLVTARRGSRFFIWA